LIALSFPKNFLPQNYLFIVGPKAYVLGKSVKDINFYDGHKLNKGK